ncbi:hypothetical protein E4U32_007968 [Claviceps aff. humidiphila group G2b]|nr:hypothetical protein E4U32_007968 [Claviceps aff. humidiphila group G2b]
MSLWGGGEEGKNELALLYDRHKEDMWSPIAAEMTATWGEVESMHWQLGKAEMEKRGLDDSFRTTPVSRVNLRVPPQATRQQGGNNRRSEWTGDEEAFLFACKEDGGGMSWKEIGDLMPGHDASACRSYYLAQTASGPEWPQERKNQLCKLYESHKQRMWAPIGDAVRIPSQYPCPWKVAERLHWRLGEKGMTERVSAFGLAPSDEDNDEVHPHSDEEPDQSSHHLQDPQHQTELAPMAHVGQPGPSMTLPSCAELKAGVDLLFGPPQ